MARKADLDLTGRWSGIYNYPHTMPPTPFEAVLRDGGGLITGETVEPGGRGGTLHAMVEGQRQGSAVRFAKLYDEPPRAAYRVDYVGAIADGGDEIHGRWQIPGNWSGTFLMVREGGAEEEAAERESAEIRA
ncbi:MAG TPA: hypothetical protein VH331_11840 [Allosphingosinicella sp.]|jgi:hypothetical protein|nr:hypothetical protein [Allosphingosinicella sp.]